MTESKHTEPDWERYGLQLQQPSKLSDADDILEDTDSDDNELFYEEQKSTLSKPWWKANFFLSERVLFGAWDGVFTSCMLNIFGIIIFLRTGWMVGNAGVGLSILIIFITLLVSTIGAMSSIGICERCKVESGGVYFLLNHVLGGQLAVAVGILYCFGQSVSCSLYTVGFGESISNLLQTSSNPWVARGFAIAALVLLTGINLAGVKWVIRLQLVLLFTIMIAAVDFIVGSFMPHNGVDGVLGYSTALLRNNTSPQYSNGESFFTVFGVFFPTACGVLSGINMSGDLRNPRKAIAIGTISATALSGTFYVIFVFVLGAIVERWALLSDFMISEKVSALGALWLIGLYVSSITSCMGGLYGAPRILQSIATSNNFPRPLSYLGMGKGANKVPVISLTVVALTSLLFICVGDVNFLAPIVTMPFLITYIAVDYAYFSLAMTADIKASASANNSTSGDIQPNSQNINKESHKELNSYGSLEETADTTKFQDTHEDTDDDLDHLFPERKLSKSMEAGHLLPGEKKENGSSSDIAEFHNELPESQHEIYRMEPSWYSRFCNRWFSLLGAVGTLAIMFATQWLYAIVSLIALALLYVYLVYTIPGAAPGIAQFSLIYWIRSCFGKKHPTNRQPHQVIVSQHSPLLTTAPAQLNDINLDFSQRRPYHQSQLRPNEELPLCCDDN